MGGNSFMFKFPFVFVYEEHTLRSPENENPALRNPRCWLFSAAYADVFSIFYEHGKRPLLCLMKQTDDRMSFFFFWGGV